jgi:hypothetical protein
VHWSVGACEKTIAQKSSNCGLITGQHSTIAAADFAQGFTANLKAVYKPTGTIIDVRVMLTRWAAAKWRAAVRAGLGGAPASVWCEVRQECAVHCTRPGAHLSGQIARSSLRAAEGGEGRLVFALTDGPADDPGARALDTPRLVLERDGDAADVEVPPLAPSPVVPRRATAAARAERRALRGLHRHDELGFREPESKDARVLQAEQRTE